MSCLRPCHFRLKLSHTCIRLMTNEPALAAALSPWAAPDEDSSAPIPEWKLIADTEAGTPDLTPILTDSGPVVTAWFGRSNLLSLDSERGEAFAFLAKGQEQFCVAVLAPLLAQWIEERGLSRTRSNPCG
jgi:hypothetical protein